MHWKRGRHRLYAALCVAWAAYWLVFVPWRSMQSSREFCEAEYDSNVSGVREEAGAGTAAHEKRSRDAHASYEDCYAKFASPTATYRESVRELSEPWIIGFLIALPIAIYVIAWGLYLPLRWVVRGFIPEKPSGG